MFPDLKQELELLLANSPTREFHPALRVNPGRIEFKGRSLINFSSWDYFNLAQHERVKRAVHEAIEHFGIGMGAARLSAGTASIHLDAEKRLARFFGTASALIFSSRNQAAFSLLTAVLSERDAIVSEDSAPLPSADAAYLVNAGFSSFPSRNLNALSKELERWKNARRKIVVAEAVSSATGQLLPLPETLELCARYNAELLVDESYSLGAVGMRGAGISDRDGGQLQSKIMCQISELCGLAGLPIGALCADATLLGLVLQRSRVLNFEISPSPSHAAALIAALDLVELMSATRSRLTLLAQQLRSGIASLLKRAPELFESPIVSIEFDTMTKANELCQALFQRGFLCEAVSHKGLLSEKASVRFVINSEISEEHIDTLLASISDLLPRLPA